MINYRKRVNKATSPCALPSHFHMHSSLISFARPSLLLRFNLTTNLHTRASYSMLLCVNYYGVDTHLMHAFSKSFVPSRFTNLYLSPSFTSFL